MIGFETSFETHAPRLSIAEAGCVVSGRSVSETLVYETMRCNAGTATFIDFDTWDENTPRDYTSGPIMALINDFVCP